MRTERADLVETTLGDPDADLHVPSLCDVEVAAALRRALLVGALTQPRAAEALDDLLDMPLTRHGHQALIHRAIELRGNFSAYDAIYVALAEKIGGSLLTMDDSLARATRQTLPIDVLPAV